jgi:hypothetical protein
MQKRNPGYTEDLVYREFVELETKIFFTISKKDPLPGTFHLPCRIHELVRAAQSALRRRVSAAAAATIWSQRSDESSKTLASISAHTQAY